MILNYGHAMPVFMKDINWILNLQNCYQYKQKDIAKVKGLPTIYKENRMVWQKSSKWYKERQSSLLPLTTMNAYFYQEVKN